MLLQSHILDLHYILHTTVQDQHKNIHTELALARANVQ